MHKDSLGDAVRQTRRNPGSARAVVRDTPLEAASRQHPGFAPDRPMLTADRLRS
ncbi:MAG: hypothetical protein QHH80_01825 [Anaerolineae bacterium]|nr:hypothetical protein [Anaerolineae bacterium]